VSDGSATSLAAAACEEMHLAKEGVQGIVREVGDIDLAARRLVMSFGRVLNAEEVVQDRPRVGCSVTRLASADE
jgi:hypothetical protein